MSETITISTAGLEQKIHTAMQQMNFEATNGLPGWDPDPWVEVKKLLKLTVIPKEEVLK